MTGSQRLERGYRRLVACYPRAFRRESEEEIIAVLMATARDGQRRVGLAESADLIRGALRMHRGPRLPRALLIAVRMTYIGAALELAVLTTLLMTLAGLTSATIRSYPYFSLAQWHAVLMDHLTPVAAGAPVLLAAWLWMACANARGHHAARVCYWVVYGIIKVAIAAEILAGVPDFGMRLVIPGFVVIIVHFAAMPLIFYPSKDPLPYRPHRQLDPAQR